MSATSNIWATYFACVLFLWVLFLNVIFFLMLDILCENHSDSECSMPPERIHPIVEDKGGANQLTLIWDLHSVLGRFSLHVILAAILGCSFLGFLTGHEVFFVDSPPWHIVNFNFGLPGPVRLSKISDLLFIHIILYFFCLVQLN